MSSLKTWMIERTLCHSYRIQQEEMIPLANQAELSPNECIVFVLFNLESVWGFGHSILGLCENGKPVQTYSFYRRSHRIIAPAKVATLAVSITFNDLLERSGWITHGISGDIWNEHMTSCMAMSCSKQQYELMLNFAEKIKAHPGTYRLITRNCIHFVQQALRAGGITFELPNGRELSTFIPKHAFDRVVYAGGAKPFGEWKYWFKYASPPDNGFSTRKVLVKNE